MPEDVDFLKMLSANKLSLKNLPPTGVRNPQVGEAVRRPAIQSVPSRLFVEPPLLLDISTSPGTDFVAFPETTQHAKWA